MVNRTPSNIKIEKIRQKFHRELNAFFDTKQNFKIEFLNRKDIKEHWIGGWVRYQKVFIVNPKEYTKISSEYYATLKHELVHLFVQSYLGRFDKPLYPKWLSEGVAVFLSGQNKIKSKPQEFKKFLSFYNKSGREIYKEAGFAVEILYTRFGKEKLLLLIKQSSRIDNKPKFNQVFRKIYGFSPSYFKFNELLK